MPSALSGAQKTLKAFQSPLRTGTLKECLRVARLLWASDYPPAVTGGNVSFAQTLDMLAEMPFLGESELRKIEGGNLLACLREIEEAAGGAAKM